jgi:DNA mismatch repair protein MLH3
MPDNNRHNRIQKLSDQAIRDVHSSKNITSIEDVAISLIRNSLDAEASKIEVTVNRSRGNCTVCDNGCGIPSCEFSDDGGLGKMYWTSKPYESDSTFRTHGTSGTFLAQLGNLSLLKICSAETDGGQPSSLTIHGGRVIHRRIDLENAEAPLQGRGTSVMVTDLFGSMPVRIKHRAAQSSAHRHQTWHALKHKIVALMLAWPYPCKIKINDEEDSSRNLRLAGSDPSQPATLSARSLRAHDGASIKYNVQDALSVLFQAEIAPWESWRSWTPVSAATNFLHLEGMICSKPAPTRACQFVALGIRALDGIESHKELYEYANRVFAKSTFSEIDQTSRDLSADVAKHDVRRLNVRAPNTRGSVDRYAMFCFRFAIKAPMPRNVDSENVSPKSLQPFLDLLRLTITAWLEKYHFIKHKGQLEDSRHPTSTTSQDPATRKEGSIRLAAKYVDQIACVTGIPSKLEKFQYVKSVDASSHLPSLSAIRIGRSTSAHNRSVRASCGEGPSTSVVTGDATRERLFEVTDQRESRPAFNLPQTKTIDANVAGVPPDGISHFAMLCEPRTTGPVMPAKENDVLHWIDPVSKLSYKINARTGVTIPDSSRPVVAFTPAELLPDINGVPQARSNPGGSAPEPSPCYHGHARGRSLAGVLADWHNPVFERRKEETITAAPMASLVQDKTSDHVSLFQSSMARMQNGGRVANISATEVISREQLRTAKVIGQVDHKFILCKIQVPKTTDHSERDVLLLIDQHAASERIILEGLLREYGVPNMLPVRTSSPNGDACLRTADVSRYTSFSDYLYYEDIPETECIRLQQYRKHFAAWGVFYEVSDLSPSSNDSGEEHTAMGRLTRVRVKNLPRAIVERCTSTPSLCIEMIRAELYDDTRKPLSQRQLEMANSELHDDEVCAGAPLWLKYISFCPQGILDMLNSRACRTAVMFNDNLSKSECEEIVRDLGLCVFPFVCAHGRKSIVPLSGLDMLPTEPC